MSSYELLPWQELEDDLVDEEDYVEYLEPHEDLFSDGYEYDFNHELENDFAEYTDNYEDHLEPVDFDPFDDIAEYYRNLPVDNIDSEALMKAVHDDITRDPRLTESMMSMINVVEGVETGEITNTESIIGASGRNSHHVDNGQDTNIGDLQAQGKKNSASYCFEKVDLEKIFVITNFVLELPSAVFDQLSSVHKPLYAFLSMLMSFAAILLCAVELFYKARKDKVTWKWGRLPWLYYPSQTHKPFGDFKDTIGLVCALCQCIVTVISFVFVSRHANNPIKVSVWPMLFAFGLLCSKFSGKPGRRG